MSSRSHGRNKFNLIKRVAKFVFSQETQWDVLVVLCCSSQEGMVNRVNSVMIEI